MQRFAIRPMIARSQRFAFSGSLPVHAKDDTARAFYAHLGFESFTDLPLTLHRLMKDIRAMAAAAPPKK